MTNQYSNTAQETTLASAATSSATTIVVSGTTGFPASTPYTLAVDADDALEELVSVTGVSGTTLTVTRGYDNTSAVSHSTGAVVRHVHSAVDFRNSREHEDASTGVHGVSGSVVGTSGAQVITDKDLSSATNTFPATLATDAELTALDTDLQAQIDGHETRIDAVEASGLVAVATGSITLSDGGTEPSTRAVSFPVGRFTAPPTVGLSPETGAATGTTSNLWVSPGTVTTSGFTAVLARNTTTSVVVTWTAIQAD